MTYIDYVNQFWKTHQSVAFSSNEVYLYFFLLNECNSRGWENPFECPNRRIVLATGISEPTVIEVRNRLQQKGLLQFESGKKNAKSPVYYLNDLSKPLSKLLSNDLSKPLSKKANINIRLKSKDNNNSSELFKPEQEKPKKKPSKPKTEFIAPTLEQVKDYFRDKLPDWEQQAEIFFYHFDALSWKNTNGAKIERWDSRANLWIIEKDFKMETRLQKQITVIMSPGQIPQSRKKPETLTPLQQTLRNGSTASQLVDNWSGTQAQLNCNLTLAQAIRIEGIPTLADINVVFGNATSVRIITEHLQSILRYAGIDIAPQQLAETALSILASYYFLNLAELCIFFTQLKNGSRGQFVWGNRINNQSIMVALSDFCRDRRDEHVKLSNETAMKQSQKGFTRIEDAACAMIEGVKNIQELKKRLKTISAPSQNFFLTFPITILPTPIGRHTGEMRIQYGLYTEIMHHLPI